jgi:non-ribosomal peptide synthetase-like protein
VKKTVDVPMPDRAQAPTSQTPHEDTNNGLEKVLADVLADVLHLERVSAGSNFFSDLGADSMVMAQFCARVRKRAELPEVSMKDVYQHPTIRDLAAAIGDVAPSTVESALTNVLANVLHVEQVSPDSNFFSDLGADSMVMAQFCARLRKGADLPDVSMKDVYQHPTIRDLAAAIGDVAPSTVESALTNVLADVLQLEQVSPDSNFFDDLGADSMVMAQFCARVRKREDLPDVSMKDVYQHPTIRGLARSLPATTSTASPPVVAHQVTVRRATTRQYVTCGVLQVLTYLGYAFVTAFVGVRGYEFISGGSGLLDTYLRSVVYGGGAFVALCALPILLKWLVIGRWKPQEVQLWSLAYFRFWLVKTVVRSNPLVLFVGSPLYILYLKALGAKIGKGVLILSRNVPITTDLLTIGDGTVIRKDVSLWGYRAHAGVIQTGSLALGKNVLVGEMSVFDINTSMGDDSQLGHASSLHAGQVVPDGGRWHGSPAQPTTVNYRTVDAGEGSTRRRGLYATGQVLTMLVLYLPAAVGGFALLLAFLQKVPQLGAILGAASLDFAGDAVYLEAAAAALVLVLGSILAGLLVTFTVPRVLSLAITPGRVYPLYGLHDSLHRTVARLSNSKFLTNLFGDSSYIVPYLRCLGYKLTPVVQTGSNFGTDIKHDSPYLNSVGTETVVASGLSIINADYSSTSFRMSRASIGARNFLGNDIAYPPQSKTGDDCLLATKVLVPIEGKVRHGVGLLGSPSFEIPRTVDRDSRFAGLDADERRRRLGAKNKHNAVTIGLFLLSRWVSTSIVTIIALWAFDLYPTYGVWVIALGTIMTLVFTLLFGVLVEHAARGFRPLPPKYCSIYDVNFWKTERFFKLEAAGGALFNGTPFKGMMWRLLGVHVGRRLFDDGGQMAEKNLVTIGDDVTINAGAWIQCHSQEDYAFKSDRITIGSGCTLGVNTEMLYSVTIGDGAVLAPDCFLMKGEEVPAHTRWGGNPAREMPEIALPVDVPRRTAVVGRHRAVRELPVVSPIEEAPQRRRPGRRHAATLAR